LIYIPFGYTETHKCYKRVYLLTPLGRGEELARHAWVTGMNEARIYRSKQIAKQVVRKV